MMESKNATSKPEQTHNNHQPRQPPPSESPVPHISCVEKYTNGAPFTGLLSYRQIAIACRGWDTIPSPQKMRNTVKASKQNYSVHIDDEIQHQHCEDRISKATRVVFVISVSHRKIPPEIVNTQDNKQHLNVCWDQDTLANVFRTA